MENRGSIKCPSYCNAEFLTNALQEGFQSDNVQVVNFNIRPSNFAGENYSSEIYRVKVYYQFGEDKVKHEIDLILKDMRAELNEMVVKTKETHMYTKVVPELTKILGGDEMLAPKFFTTGTYRAEVYVLEDLSVQGYEVKDRIQGFDEKDCILVLKKIARFHAASMVYAKKFPEVIETIKEHPFQYGTKTMTEHVNFMIQNTCDMISQWEGYEPIADKVKKLFETMDERVKEVFDSSQARYKVINHGDLWVNNLLFKDDEISFIDLQLSSYGSPAVDIHNFLGTSVPLKLLKLRRNEFLRIYYNEFHDTLRRINYKNIPKWDDFMHEMKRMEFSALWILIVIFPLIAMEKEDSKGDDPGPLNDLAAFAKKQKAVYKLERFQAKFRYALDRLNLLGVLG